MKLGVLETGQVKPPLDRFGDYTHMFRRLFLEADPDLEVERYRLILGEAPKRTDECDAWLITGSAHGVHDAFDWLQRLEDFVSELDAARSKTIGVCFGHQLIAKVLGGEVERAKVGWCTGATPYRVEQSSEYEERELRMIASHRDQVTRLPSDAVLTLSAERCPNAGFTIGEHMITVQGHPEFRPDFASALYKKRRGAIGERACHEAIDSLKKSLDNLEVARDLVKFLRD